MTNGKPFPKDVVEHWPEVFGEITLNVVPLKYLDSVTVTFKNKKVWEYEQIQKISFGETIKILKLAAKKYSNPEYEALAKKIDLKTYQSDIIELTY